MTKIKKFIEKIDIKSVSVSVVVRLIMMIVAMIAWVFKMFGIIPPQLNESDVFNVVITLFGIIAFLQAYWKNNSWTKAAQIADSVMQYKKEELKGVDWNEKSK